MRTKRFLSVDVSSLSNMRLKQTHSHTYFFLAEGSNALKFDLLKRRFLNAWILTVLGIFLSCLPSTNLAIAETLDYCGVAIPLDGLKAIDADSVKVAIGSDERIIARASLEHWALEKTVVDPSRLSKVSTKELQSFLNECSTSEAPLVVTISLIEILKRGEEKSFSARQFLNFSENNQQMLKVAIENGAWESSVREDKSTGQIGLISESLAELVILDPIWVKTKALRLYYLLSEPIYLILYERTKEELAANNSKYISQLASSLDAFGDEYSKNIAHLKLAANLSQELNKVPFNSESFASVVATLQRVTLAKDGYQVQDLLYPILSEKLIAEVSRLLKEKKLEEAANIFSLLPTGKTSPEVLSFGSEVLRELTENPMTLVEDRTYALLEAFSKNDTSFANQYFKFLEIQFSALLNLGQSAEAGRVLQFIVKVRPDPDSRNDGLRFEQALEYKRQGEDLKASETISQMQTGLSVSQSLRNLVSAQLLMYVASALGLLLLVIASLWLILKTGVLHSLKANFVTLMEALPKKVKSEVIKETVKEKTPDVGESLDREPTAFVRLDPMRGSSAIRETYEKNLAAFGLDGKASLRDIKASYRTAVKECHPDLNPQQGEERTQRFTELTLMYEELLDLRKQLGIVD